MIHKRVLFLLLLIGSLSFAMDEDKRIAYLPITLSQSGRYKLCDNIYYKYKFIDSSQSLITIENNAEVTLSLSHKKLTSHDKRYVFNVEKAGSLDVYSGSIINVHELFVGDYRKINFFNVRCFNGDCNAE